MIKILKDGVETVTKIYCYSASLKDGARNLYGLDTRLCKNDRYFLVKIYKSNGAIVEYKRSLNSIGVVHYSKKDGIVYALSTSVNDPALFLKLAKVAAKLAKPKTPRYVAVSNGVHLVIDTYASNSKSLAQCICSDKTSAHHIASLLNRKYL